MISGAASRLLYSMIIWYFFIPIALIVPAIHLLIINPSQSMLSYCLTITFSTSLNFSSLSITFVPFLEFVLIEIQLAHGYNARQFEKKICFSLPAVHIY